MFFKDRCLETTTSTGTANLTLAGAVTGFRTLSSVHDTGELISYCIEGVDANKVPTGEWEIGYGNISTTTNLVRLLAIESSNAGAFVNFSAGTKLVYTNLSSQLANSDVMEKQFSSWMTAANSATVPTVNGMNAFTAIVAGTLIAPATTNKSTRVKRIRYSTTAVAGNVNGIYIAASGSLHDTISDGSAGGFVYRWRISTATIASTARAFWGLRNIVTAPTNVALNTLTNHVGFGYETGGSGISTVGSGSAFNATNLVDLGANLTIGGTDLIDFTLIAPMNKANQVLWGVKRVGVANAAASGLFSNVTPGTTMPSSTTLLGPAFWITNNATAAITQFDMVSLAKSSEY